MSRQTPQPETDGTSHQTVWRHLPAIFLAALCGLVFYEAATTLTEQGYASGTPISNAALYPRLLAGLLLILLAAQVVSDIRARGASAGGEPAATPDRAGQTGLAALGMIVYVALLPVLGFLLATPLFVLTLLLMLGDRNPTTLGGVTLAITAGCLFVFQGLFNVNLPRGLFGIALNF